MTMNSFCEMVDPQKALRLICNQYHCHRLSPLPISDAPRARFESSQGLKSEFKE